MGSLFMKKLENYKNSLDILKHANFEMANEDEIYRIGIIGQFHLTFELAWKALQAVLRIHGSHTADTGSPREILQAGYRHGFINDAAVWLVMLKKRNQVIHIYDEDRVDEVILLIRDSFLPAFEILAETLDDKLSETEKDWEPSTRAEQH